MSNFTTIIRLLALQILLLLGACGTVTRTDGANAGLEVEITKLPSACSQSRKDAMTVSMTIDNGHQPPIGPFGANQEGTSIKKTFKKNSVDGADLFIETNKCSPLRFCVTLGNLTDACAAALSQALGQTVGNGSVLCTGWITPSPCGVWEFKYTDLH